jgi:hypothetical protein
MLFIADAGVQGLQVTLDGVLLGESGCFFRLSINTYLAPQKHHHNYFALSQILTATGEALLLIYASQLRHYCDLCLQ